MLSEARQDLQIGIDEMKKSKIIGNSKRSLGGFSLVEMLVVTLIFSILGVVVTRSLALSIQGTRKSENLSVVKGNVEFALSTMERLLRNARSLNCTLSSGSFLSYTDEYGNVVNFQCVLSSGIYHIASRSASVRLTTPEVTVSNCSPPAPSVFTNCNSTTIPHSIDITITGAKAGSSGAEGAQFNSRTRILLRNY